MLGREHPYVALTLNYLAEVYCARARFADAEPLLTRCMAICEKNQGPEHPSVAQCLNRLGELYRSLGRSAKRSLRAAALRP